MYTFKDCSILFPNVSEAEFVNRMKKHYRASRMLHSYNPADEDHVCEPTAVSHPSEIRHKQFGAIRKEFVIPDDFQIRVPNAKERAHLLPKGWMAVYRGQLKAGLRLPLHNMFLDVTSY